MSYGLFVTVSESILVDRELNSLRRSVVDIVIERKSF